MAKKSLEERIQRLEDIHEIQNLMSKRTYWHMARLDAEIGKNFAEKTPGVSHEIAAWGVWLGTEGVRKYYTRFIGRGSEETGTMFIHTLTTPVIEVAGDGKTAKGVWISPGVETHRAEGGELRADWCWAKYGFDFVKEDGKWKFWHSHVYRIFRCPYDKSWVETPQELEGTITVPDELKPDRPTTYDWAYSPTGKTENVPAPPEPYETWDGKSMA